MKTSGNTVFISGGSAGIGLAIAKKLNADELFVTLQKSQLDVPVGDSKQFFK